MEARNVFVTGANRGLGLAFVKQLLSCSTHLVKLFAACRDPGTAQELQSLAISNPALHIVQLDVCDESRYRTIVSELAEELGNEGLNVLFNNAAVLLDVGGLEELTSPTVMQQFRVNTMAPLMLTKAFLPLLRKSARNAGGTTGHGIAKAAVFNMSTTLASINLVSKTSDALKYGYRISKCGLDMCTRLLHQELSPEGILCVSLDPGWAKTDMGTEAAPMTAQESVEALIKVMTEATEEQGGLLVNYDGSIQPF